MTSFVFETIAAPEAAAFGAADSLSFQTAGATGAMTTVLYGANDQISLVLGDRTVVFGAAMYGKAASFANGSILYVGGLGQDDVTGTTLGDGLFGSQGADSLAGGAGNDLLQGNQGSDLLMAGIGADTVFGGQGDDSIDVGAGVNFAHGNLGNDTVSAAGSTEGSILLGGQGDDRVVGGDGGDVLAGNLGADTVEGGAGVDVLTGDGGADLLTGGAGADRFAFAVGSSDAHAQVTDRITDWTGEDLIDTGLSGGALYAEITPAQVYSYSTYTYSPGAPFTYDSALSQADGIMAGVGGPDIVAAQVGADVVLFIDAGGPDDMADLAVVLTGRTLADIDTANILGASAWSPIDMGGGDYGGMGYRF